MCRMGKLKIKFIHFNKSIYSMSFGYVFTFGYLPIPIEAKATFSMCAKGISNIITMIKATKVEKQSMAMFQYRARLWEKYTVNVKILVK